jgi:hypothetical protein
MQTPQDQQREVESKQRQSDAENRQLLKIIEGLVKAILITVLGLAIALFTLIPQQKEANFFHHAKQLGVIIIRQFTRFFPGEYATSDRWREKANEYIRVWNEIMNGVSGNTHRGDTNGN